MISLRTTFRKVIAAVAAAAIVTTAPTALALERVEITGTKQDLETIMNDLGMQMQFLADATLTANLELTNQIGEYITDIFGAWTGEGDVRCAAGGDAKDVKSTSDVDTRRNAANQAFRATYLREGAFGRIWAGLGPGRFTVMYADGGTETWTVVSPVLSEALAPNPVPGSQTPPPSGGVPPADCS
jgi:hypothetical protein